MRIITHADDFGHSEGPTRATIECLDAGALTSASIMPTMPATGLAVEYARAHPDKSFGIHLTYITDTIETPVSDPATLPSLTTPEGRFHPSWLLRRKMIRGQVSIPELERETAAQIQKLLDMGVPLSHVDSHGHLHKYGPFRKALARVLPRFGITKVRNVQNVYLKKPLKSPTFWLGFWWRWRLMRRWKTTQYFFMPPPKSFDESWAVHLLQRIRGGDQTTLEIGVHPGHEEWRDPERKAILAFASTARSAGHRLITWNDL